MDCADISISNNTVDVLIATDIYACNLTDFAQDDSGGFIDAINDVNLMYCADIKVSDDVADGLIAIAIDAGNSTDCVEYAAGGYITTIDSCVSMSFDYLSI